MIPIPVETDAMLAILNLPKEMSNNGIFKEHQVLVLEMIHSLVLQEHYDRATHDDLPEEEPLLVSFRFGFCFLMLQSTCEFLNLKTLGDGLVLLGFFAIFLVYTHNLSKQGAESESSSRRYSLPISLAFIAGGLIGLILGGNLVVTFAVKLARLFGMSESVIGLTIVAIGTSLPELSTSLIAALKKKPDIAVGNVIGSNIFNLLLIMGVTSLVSPMPYDRIFNPGQFVMIGSTLLLFIMMFNPKRHRIDRWEGAILVIIYILYSAFFLK